jgi:hypothetical protein
MMVRMAGLEPARPKGQQILSVNIMAFKHFKNNIYLHFSEKVR